VPYPSRPNFNAATGHLITGLSALGLGVVALALYGLGRPVTGPLAGLFSLVLVLWGAAGAAVLLILLPPHPKGLEWLEGALVTLGGALIPGILFLLSLRKLNRVASASGS
jgi:hypothetical protein